MKQLLKNFKNDQSGNFALILAITATLLVAGIGAALDTSNIHREKQSLQHALDSASMAAARAYTAEGKSQIEAIKIGNDAFLQNYPGKKSTKVVKFVDDAVVRATTTLAHETMLMGMFGHNEIDINAVSEVALPQGRQQADISIALDLTSSMVSYVDDTKAAVDGFLAEIETVNAINPGEIRVGIVPWADMVKLNTSYAGSGWLDESVMSAEQVFDGCIWRREGAWVATEADPDGTPESLYQIPPADTTWVDTNCGSSYLEIQPLTDNISDLRGFVGTITSDHLYGSTDITLGAVWGTNLLTDTLPFNNTDTQRKKILILMTDGLNFLNASMSRVDTRTGVELDPETILACDNAKAQDITVYTINIVNGSSTLLDSCATDETKSFMVSHADLLEDVFDSIAAGLRQSVDLAFSK